MEITSEYKFLGGSVQGVSMSGGNGNGTISLDVTIIEDSGAGDVVESPPAWTPLTFEMGGLRFRGLLQFHQRIRDISNWHAYRVVLVDPRVVLEGTTVVTADFLDPIPAPNVLNIYGYWEDKLGFGGSMVSSQGTLWNGVLPDLVRTDDGFIETGSQAVGVLPGVHALMRETSDYGGPLTFRGHTYTVDLSGLANAPETVRVNAGTASSLMSIVESFAQEAGIEYQVTLSDDNVIGFRHIKKDRPITPGVLAHWAGSQPNCISNTIGYELADEITNVVLQGGLVHTLNQVHGGNGSLSIWPFWGLDVDGVPVFGEGDPAEEHRFNLPCGVVADVVGDVFYPCSIAELRAAAVDVDSWSAYLVCQEPEKAAILDVVSAVDHREELSEIFGEAMLRRDLLADDEKTASLFGGMNQNEYWTKRVGRIYDFLHEYATQYLGRKFLVQIPFPIQKSVKPEQFGYFLSDEVAEGGYLPENGTPLGLPYESIDKFLLEDGRFGCFVRYDLDPRMKLEGMDYEQYEIIGDSLYVRGDLEQGGVGGVYWIPGRPLPYAVVSVNEAVQTIDPDPLGGVADIAKMLNLTKEQVLTMVGTRTGSFPVRLGPSCYIPKAVALPTRSNRRRYGPWTAGNGTAGKTEVIVDEEVTPWGCGDVSTMEQVAINMIKSIPTGLQEIESGSLTLADAPLKSVGETLVDGGPALTSLSVGYGIDGLQTTYDFRTYTPTFGAFSRQNAEKLKIQGVNQKRSRYFQRNALYRQKIYARTMQRSIRGRGENLSRAVSQRSPHECLMSIVTADMRNPEEVVYRTGVAAMSPEEMMANMRADKRGVYMNVAGMGMEGLLRPISTNFDPENYPPPPEEGIGDEPLAPYVQVMPHFEKPHEILEFNPTTTKMMNPFMEWDGDLIITGNDYRGLHNKKRILDENNARVLAQRGPIALSGYGYEMTGKPIPNAEPAPLVKDWSDDYLENHKLHAEVWKAGLVELRWDDWRKIYAAPGCHYAGKTVLDIDGDGEGEMFLDFGRDQYTEETFPIFNSLGFDIPAGTKVYIGFFPLRNQWGVISAQCEA